MPWSLECTRIQHSQVVSLWGEIVPVLVIVMTVDVYVLITSSYMFLPHQRTNGCIHAFLATERPISAKNG